MPFTKYSILIYIIYSGEKCSRNLTKRIPSSHIVSRGYKDDYILHTLLTVHSIMIIMLLMLNCSYNISFGK